ncbi:MAG: ABC transporter permease [Verrucomicrobia bacterium]|nr:ABC transporter permease [Verrucomicrobiota bacterium]
MKQTSQGPSWKWVLLMSWRDSRRNRLKLVLFVLSIVFGLAAMVAIRGFRTNVEDAIQAQSKELLGADVEFHSNAPYSDEMESFISDLGGKRVDEVRMSTMALFESNGGSRLVQVRAFERAFPFYGVPETRPEGIIERFHDGRYVMMEESLMFQFSVAEGDRVKIGEIYFEVLGIVDRIPGESNLTGWVAPRVYISKNNLEATGLLQFGSRVSYRAYVQLENAVTIDADLGRERGFFRENRVSYDTVKEEQDQLGRSFQGVADLLNLIGFMALILGGVGVTSAVHVYLSGKMDTIAILRCLGTKSSIGVSIFLVQISGLGLLAALVGSLAGTAIQYFVPLVIKDFLPFELLPRFAWVDLFVGLLFGWLVCFLFTLLPLLPLRKISPLRVLRAGVEKPENLLKDPWVLAVLGALGITIFGFGLVQTDKEKMYLAFCGGLVAVLAILALISWLFLNGVKKLVPKRLPFAWRYGIANLYRPNNRTLLMITSLGLGFIIVLTLFLTKEAILDQLIVDRGANASNMIFFDIQSEQLEGVTQVINENELPIIEKAPLVNMRITEVNGKTVQEISRGDRDRDRDRDRGKDQARNEESSRPESWTLRREYRSTYRDHLTDSETLIEGVFTGASSMDVDYVPVSISKGLSEDMKLGIGDKLVFDIQGLPLDVEITSIREVDWNQVRANFFFVFPTGVLEEAPSMFILATRTPDPQVTAKVQAELITRFPNVSVIDLRLILATVDSILTKIAWVVQFMALFTICAGLLVMAGTIITSRYQRIRESVLLRTLGADSKIIIRILFIEFAAVGFLAALVGGFVSVGATWALMTFLFKLPLVIAWDMVVYGMLSMMVLTTGTGLLNTRGITHQSPLEILRQE